MFSSKGSSAGVENKLANGTARDVSPLYYQANHIFVVGDVVYRKSDGTFAKADCTTGTTSEVAGIVKSVKGTGRFTLAQIGEVDLVAANFTEAALPSTDGATCFLSATAGKLTVTEPSTVGYVSKPIVVYTSGGKGLFFNMRGTTVGGTNLYTSIGLSSGTATTLQSISGSSFVAGSGGFIEGFIKVAGSSVNTITTFKVEFTKPASGTGYTCTVSYGGEALPSGSSIDITTGGAIQLTLPTISGFTSGTATFAMQASAIGATLPLQIDADKVNTPGSTAIYSAGAWSLKNGSGTETFAVSSAGAVTAIANMAIPALISSSTTGNAGVILKVADNTRYNWLLGSQYSAGNTFEITPSTAVGGSTFTTPVATCSSAGAWTWGPASTYNAQLKTKVNGGGGKACIFGQNESFTVNSGGNVTLTLTTSAEKGALVLISVSNAATADAALVLCGHNNKAAVVSTTNGIVSETNSPGANTIGVKFTSSTGVLTIYGGTVTGSHTISIIVMSSFV